MHNGQVGVDEDVGSVLMGRDGDGLVRIGEMIFDSNFFGRVGDGLFTTGEIGFDSDGLIRKEEIDD